MFEYFPCSTPVLSRSTVVLPRQYCSTAKEVLELDKTLSISSFLLEYSLRLFHQSAVAVLKVQELSLGR